MMSVGCQLLVAAITALGLDRLARVRCGGRVLAQCMVNRSRGFVWPCSDSGPRSGLESCQDVVHSDGSACSVPSCGFACTQSASSTTSEGEEEEDHAVPFLSSRPSMR
eukprot:TRINITY_DN68613_c0_g1_i1.p1 TRINITY_DN68613_c0_g1~~TRINITY_DN68613_c0_g1_i1.p1  ORF type:complete len:125 (+),score=12.72 TRINITY_DN68613_c0_g1_i1:54-377(+)